MAPKPAGRPRWERLEEARAWPVAAAPFVATGHADGEYAMEVHAAAATAPEYLGLTAGRRWPVGMTVAAFHRHRADGEPGSIYAMTKLAGGAWEYVVAAPDGTLEGRGALPLCAGCHAAAPADSLFGVPRVHPEPAASTQGP